MKGPDLFIVGVRLLGAWLLIQSMVFLISFLDVRLGFTPIQDARITNPNAYLLYVAGYFLAALVFLFGAGYLARLCYGGVQTPDRPDQGNADDLDIRYRE